MAKASEQMEKALKVSECVPEIGTELHRERLLSKLLDEAVVDGDPQTILLFKGLVRAAGEEDEGEAGTLGECATSGEATAWLQQNWKKGSIHAGRQGCGEACGQEHGPLYDWQELQGQPTHVQHAA